MKRLVETQTIKSAMNDMSPTQKHTSLTQAFKVWSMDNCSLHEERHGKSCHVLRQPQFAAQCLLTRGVRPESSLGQLSIGGGGSVLLSVLCLCRSPTQTSQQHYYFSKSPFDCTYFFLIYLRVSLNKCVTPFFHPF